MTGSNYNLVGHDLLYPRLTKDIEGEHRLVTIFREHKARWKAVFLSGEGDGPIWEQLDEVRFRILEAETEERAYREAMEECK